MKRHWIRDHGLLLANLALFAVFFLGMVATGFRVSNEELRQHGEAAQGLAAYLSSGDFVEATFENWESEFLQMGMYVLLTAWLFTRGSSESKPLDEPYEGDEDPRAHRGDPGVPWPVRRGGMVLRVYEHSLSLGFLLLFLLSLLAHAAGGASAYSAQQEQHGQPGVSLLGYLGTSQFWFESFQNWQSEFIAVASIVGATIWLRERGSAESKPVHASHRGDTGS